MDYHTTFVPNESQLQMYHVELTPLLYNKDEELETLIEYRPALDQVRLMQCYNGLVNDGYLNESGSVNMRMMGYMVKKMRCKALARPASVPASVFKLMLNVSYLIGKLSGWNKLYEKYTQ